MHITLIRPPIFSSINSFSSPVTPPLALAYLSASLRKKQFSVESIDAVGEAINKVYLFQKPKGRVRGLPIEKILQRIPGDTDLIGISCMFSQEWPFVKSLVNSIALKFPDTAIVLGGEHITAIPEFVLESCPSVDICALGEGEETIIDIAKNYPNNLENIDGILYRAENGEFVQTAPRKRIRNIEEIPRPDWGNVQIEPYFKTEYRIGINTGRAMPILATRGCPYQCTFCSNEQMWGLNYYTRSPQDVVDEIEEYIHRYQIDSVDFYDLTAIIKKDWILEFGTLLKSLKTDIAWSLPSGTRSEALDPEVTRLMGETNCKYLVYAAESGSPKILDHIKKKVNLNNMIDSMKEAKQNGLSIRCNLMLGFPTESRLDVFKTIVFQIRISFIGVDDAPLYMFAPYPGTELFEYLLKKKRIKAIDDEYFRSLLCQMDLSKSSEFCENIGPKELALYRFIGMSIFYTLSYLLHPARIFRSVKNIFFSGKTNTVFEQRVTEYFKTKNSYS